MACKALPRASRWLNSSFPVISRSSPTPRLFFLYPRGATLLSTTATIIEEPTDAELLTKHNDRIGYTSSSITPSLAQRDSISLLSPTTSTPDPHTAHQPPRTPPPPLAPSTPLTLTPNLATHLPLLAAQTPHYITIHLHGKPYLVTQGDTLRLPFRMPGVLPGDILRFTRASTLGSRDFTLRAGRSSSSSASTTSRRSRMGSAASMDLLPDEDFEDPSTATTTHEIQLNNAEATKKTSAEMVEAARQAWLAKGPAYVDERLFVCRAVVLGTETEPMRVVLKTQQRQRRVKTVKSKGRFTVLRINEVRVLRTDELERAI